MVFSASPPLPAAVKLIKICSANAKIDLIGKKEGR
jgi:hypothetical protein